MTDLEITQLCAEAMVVSLMGSSVTLWNPLHDDAQAMALLSMLLTCGNKVVVENDQKGRHPILVFENAVYQIYTLESFRRAVCTCVAKMQAEKK